MGLEFRRVLCGAVGCREGGWGGGGCVGRCGCFGGGWVFWEAEGGFGGCGGRLEIGGVHLGAVGCLEGALGGGGCFGRYRVLWGSGGASWGEGVSGPVWISGGAGG